VILKIADFEVLTVLYVLSCDNWPFTCLCLFVCLSVSMDARLASTWTVGWVFFVFSIQEFVDPMSAAGEYGHFSSKK
jgi:hypothetical protein